MVDSKSGWTRAHAWLGFVDSETMALPTHMDEQWLVLQAQNGQFGERVRRVKPLNAIGFLLYRRAAYGGATPCL